MTDHKTCDWPIIPAHPAVDGYLAVTGNVCGVEPQRKRLIDALNAKIPGEQSNA